MAVNVDESFIRLQPGILPENALLSFVSAEGSDGCADEVLGDQVEDMEVRVFRCGVTVAIMNLESIASGTF
ncbi:hypothetical protein GN244_ATG02273 [Phytophthora infestans]|uniref:Uncharacterized protein n=1 Tax=Phytophthora infestans TaxID=4787 RepID=A0A833WLN2_PHYIN|nr:hypothetical protein GN244_ATG02273 [Phytophthora infestans]